MKKHRSLLIVAIIALFFAQGFIHSSVLLPRWQKDYRPGKGMATSGLNPDQFLFALIGMREFVAGILWVRADSFFETGNYDAILPLIRLVTWLDPKQIDVYATGMWHIGYNFTDEQQRSDRRYIKPALALGKEGAANNPDTYEMFFEVGWMWFHKIDDDYEQAVKWFELAQTKPDMQYIPARKNLLTKAYEKNGQLKESMDLMVKLGSEQLAEIRRDKDVEYNRRSNYDSLEQNLDNLLVRMAQRGWLARQRADGSYEAGDYDTKNPYDVGFSGRVTIEDPKVLRVDGTWNVLPVGTRVRMVLRCADYDSNKYAELDWDSGKTVDLEPERNHTIMQDALFVKNGRINRVLDLSKDPTMYPFNEENYVIEFYYNPRSAPDHMKDKFGFDGEGFTDKNFLNTDIRPGVRVMYVRLPITKDMIFKQGDWYGRVPVVKTKNFKSVTDMTGQDEIVVLPPLRSSGNNKNK